MLWGTKKQAVVLAGLIGFLILSACATSQEEGIQLPKTRTQTKSTRQERALLPQRYQIIVVEPVAIPVGMVKKYPLAARTCQSSTIAALRAKKAFELVHHTAPDKAASPVLLVRCQITDMRLTTRNNRLWAGSPANSSYINMDVQLVDAASQKILQEKQLSTISAAPASPKTATGGDSEITKAMGALLGEYVFSIMPPS